MTYTLTNSTTITQTGTDTSYAGMSGLAGVTTIANGNGFVYILNGISLIINGTVTISDQSSQSFTCLRLTINAGGSLTSGSFAADGVTPLRGGNHFTLNGAATEPINDFCLTVAGNLTLIGGSWVTSGAISFTSTAVIRGFGTSAVSSKTWGGNSTRVRSFASNVILRSCLHYGIGFDLFRIPTEFSVKAFASQYLAQYVGSLFGGVDAKFTASALSNTDGTLDFDNYANGWVELYNCSKGANLGVVCQNSPAVHLTPLFQDVSLLVTDLSGSALDGVNIRCVDQLGTNTPTTTQTTIGGLKTWDFRAIQTYSGATNSVGRLTLSPVLQIYTGANTKNLRFASSIAPFKVCGYRGFEQINNVTLGSDTPIAVQVALTTPPFLTLTESQAGALTSVALVASGATSGLMTASSIRTTAELWQYYRSWIAQLANFNSTDTWRFDGTILNTGLWNARIDVGSGTTNLAINLTSPTITINNTSASAAIVTVPFADITKYVTSSTGGGSISVRSVPTVFTGFPTANNINGYAPQSTFGILNETTNTWTTYDASSGSVSVSLSTLGTTGQLLTFVADARGWIRTPSITGQPLSFAGPFNFSNLFIEVIGEDGRALCGLGDATEKAKLNYNQSIGTFELGGGGIRFAALLDKIEEDSSSQTGLTIFDTTILRQFKAISNPYVNVIALPSALKVQANSSTTISPVLTDCLIVVAGNSAGDPFTHSGRPEVRSALSKLISDPTVLAAIKLSTDIIPALL